jgi:hypothetical protein
MTFRKHSFARTTLVNATGLMQTVKATPLINAQINIVKILTHCAKKQFLTPPHHSAKNRSQWQTSILTVNTPSQREWQGLTDEEISNLWNAPGDSGNEFARAIEAKLKEKNNA